MTTYNFPTIDKPENEKPNEIFLVASGDLRLSANQTCWAAQEEMENLIIKAFSQEGFQVKRAHPYNPELKHGFIWSQRMGMDIFKTIPPIFSIKL